MNLCICDDSYNLNEGRDVICTLSLSLIDILGYLETIYNIAINAPVNNQLNPLIHLLLHINEVASAPPAT